ncbi:MAG: hypothetical protein IJ491_01570 [Clostridia bacterium]|nr:hypothetical protein [Clostridia bacterium]
MNYTDWAMQELSSLPNTKSAYLYKQEVIAKMTERANALVDMGLKDNNVINELLKDEFKNIKDEYYDAQKLKQKKNRKKTLGKMSVLGIMGYTLLLVIFFLAVSFLSGAWSKTWLIMVAGVLLPIAAAMLVSATNIGGKKAVFNFASRFLMSSAIMLVCVVIFLVATFLTPMPSTWLIFLFAVALILAVDMAMAFAAKQKTAIITSLLYVPAIASIVYVICGLLHILPWHPGWIIIVLSVVADILIAGGGILRSAKVKEETDEQWEEN